MKTSYRTLVTGHRLPEKSHGVLHTVSRLRYAAKRLARTSKKARNAAGAGRRGCRMGG